MLIHSNNLDFIILNVQNLEVIFLTYVRYWSVELTLWQITANLLYINWVVTVMHFVLHLEANFAMNLKMI